MDACGRELPSLRQFTAGQHADGRSPVIAEVMIKVDLLRKNERTLTDDELSDEEAEAFGYC